MTTTFKQYLLESTTHFPIHDTLNQRVWDGESLRPEVKDAIKKIAKEFEEFLESPDVTVVDVIFTGSLANFNYTKYSDIDIHLIVDASSKDNEECKVDLREFFMTKKNLWNQTHNIKIHEFPVEVYAQLHDEDITAGGVFSVTTNKWIKVPRSTQQKYDKYAVEIKAKHFIEQINNSISDKVDDREFFNKLMAKIRDMRKSGLEKGGEFSEENLAFKVLRNGGHLERLNDYRAKLKDAELSI